MSLQEAHLIASIQTLLGNDERLIYFFFHHKNPSLRLGVDELLEEARSLSRGEFLLIQAAIDFWNGEGGFRLRDGLDVWDDENVMFFVRALLRLREIDIEEVMDGITC
jgi:hypothetical protein